MTVRLDRRSAGLLLHPTSLPGPFESGDLGPSAHRFVDALAAARHAWWQVLPLVPAGPGFSPYSGASTFAGDPLLVSLETLAAEGLLDAGDPALVPCPAGDKIDHVASRDRRRGALARAFAAFEAAGRQCELDAFLAQEASWLPDWALFAALKRAHGGGSFHDWPEDERRRDPAALARARQVHERQVRLEIFCQLQFARQLAALRDHARKSSVALLGDLPIYVDNDSAEVWAHPELFQIDDATGAPSVVAGVPPDAFSDEGQRWGNPLWDWDALARTGHRFWIERLRSAFSRFDAVRLDHFIGFSRYWAVPAEAKSAKEGTFHPGPADRFFDAVFAALGPVQLVAEDLGVVTDEVRALRDAFHLPGMSVGLFSFSPDPGAEAWRIHSFLPRSVAYTGTHDNDTARGWIASAPDAAPASSAASWKRERDFALEYLATTEDRFADDLVRAVYRSAARTAIVPVQDVLGLGREARMNRPGVAEGNWSWRLRQGAIDAHLPRLKRLAELFGRAS